MTLRNIEDRLDWSGNHPVRLPDEAYAREIAALDRTAAKVVWCAIGACKSPIGGPGYVGGGEAMLCARCEIERIADGLFRLSPEDLAAVPGI